MEKEKKSVVSPPEIPEITEIIDIFQAAKTEVELEELFRDVTNKYNRYLAWATTQNAKAEMLNEIEEEIYRTASHWKGDGPKRGVDLVNNIELLPTANRMLMQSQLLLVQGAMASFDKYCYPVYAKMKSWLHGKEEADKKYLESRVRSAEKDNAAYKANFPDFNPVRWNYEEEHGMHAKPQTLEAAAEGEQGEEPDPRMN